jgi:23S rRNA pseudouridine2605 synthase
MRLQKFLSEQGYCSRRKAEELIKDGKVKVNEEVAKIGQVVDPETVVIKIGSRIIKRTDDKKYYIALNKPVKIISSTSDKQGMTVLGLLSNEDKKKIGHVHLVGRLDKDSEGLILLTNDGEMTNVLTHPKFEHEKEYEIIFTSNDKELEQIPKEDMDKLENGMYIGRGEKVEGIGLKNIKKDGRYFIVNTILKEGKNRQIRKMFGRLGYNLLSLKRIRIKNLKLDNLESGKYKFVDKKNIL